MKKITRKIISGLLCLTLAAGAALLPAAAEPYGQGDIVLGDINLDGNIDSTDALDVLMVTVGKSTYYSDEDENAPENTPRYGIADVNSDGYLDSVDALLILRFTVGKISEFTADKPDYNLSEASLNFSAELLKNKVNKENGNTLISPLSAMYALGMLCEGANGRTKYQIESLISTCFDSTRMDCANMSGELESYIEKYADSMNEYNSGVISNSVWADNKLGGLNEGFSDIIKKNYKGEIVTDDLNTPEAVEKINAWIEKNTDGEIKDMLTYNPEDNISMYIVNALYANLIWKEKYNSAPAADAFTNYDGTKSTAEYLTSIEDIYLHDDYATGYIKKYAGNYAFVSILPNEGVDLYDYIGNMTGSSLYNFIHTKNGINSYRVHTKCPQFKTEINISLADTLKSMGMTDAFDLLNSDFYGISEKNSFVQDIKQAAKIELNADGTKASAATIVIMNPTSSPLPENIIDVNVNLDRPFAYVIYDLANNVPLFMGTVTSF